jgi:hypothetical protein
MRNRVFHHEPIWHWRDLAPQHGELWQAIEWINPAMLEMIKILDRFSEVYRQGIQPFEKALKEVVMRIGKIPMDPT